MILAQILSTGDVLTIMLSVLVATILMVMCCQRRSGKIGIPNKPTPPPKAPAPPWNRINDIGERSTNGREKLMEGREHLTVTGQFQSDKYEWCPAGFLPLKISDEMADDECVRYAYKREYLDPEFTRDLLEALVIQREKDGR